MADQPLLLVADDDEDILTLIEFRLARSGFDVILARDGDEALRLVEERRPDLAVLDWMMPGRSGLEVMRAMRESESTAHIPVVVLTARVSASDLDACIEAGADAYLEKPFSPLELTGRVHEILAAA